VYGARRARRRDRTGLIGAGAIWALLGAALGVTDVFPGFQQLGYAILIVGVGIVVTGIVLAVRDRGRPAIDRHDGDQ
jgi:hypothetical protein